MKPVKEKLLVLVEYEPSTNEEDFKLSVKINGNGTCVLVPLGARGKKDMTVDEILEYVKEVVEGVLRL
jgi:hypothetical protein